MPISDLLTSLSILTAVAAALVAWQIDRTQRKREYADKIRVAASVTLSKVDRGQMIFLGFYQLIQPLITEIDALFVKTKDTVQCRDKLWQDLHNTHIRVLTKFDEEEIELSYGPLMSHQADIYDLFATSVAAAKASYQKSFERFLATSQDAILSASAKTARSAELGNTLRNLAAGCELELKMHLGNALAELTKLLRTIVQLDDRDIRNRRLVSAMVADGQKRVVETDDVLPRSAATHGISNREIHYRMAIASRFQLRNSSVNRDIAIRRGERTKPKRPKD